jgi:hypothetical protein
MPPPLLPIAKVMHNQLSCRTNLLLLLLTFLPLI